MIAAMKTTSRPPKIDSIPGPHQTFYQFTQLTTNKRGNRLSFAVGKSAPTLEKGKQDPLSLLLK
jgi:hypothetical protein